MIPTQQQALAAMQSHFKAIREREPLIIAIDEWQVDGQPLTLYFHPPNLREKVAARNALKESDDRGIVEQIICRARREDGTMQFTPEDDTRKTLIEKVDPDILADIALRIFEYDHQENEAEAAKNWPGTSS